MATAQPSPLTDAKVPDGGVGAGTVDERSSPSPFVTRRTGHQQTIVASRRIAQCASPSVLTAVNDPDGTIVAPAT